jgi:hypothetical protein
MSVASFTDANSSMNASNSIKEGVAEVRIAGKTLYVPSAEICGRTVVVRGSWLRCAAIKDEDVVEGEIVDSPAVFLEGLKRSALRADIFSFYQKIPESTPKYSYPFEWDNSAGIPLTNFEDWWGSRIARKTRGNVRRAAKYGVVVRPVEFDDEFARGIYAIYNETPIRQGRRFWHFGKDFDTVKMESATYLDRSVFLGAYLNDELIGYIKMIQVDQTATIIQIISKIVHKDKRPTNALIAKAVEVCLSKGLKLLLYGKFVYDGDYTGLTEFKHRNGFEEMRYPRYFIPLTVKGAAAVRLGIYKGLRRLIPLPILVASKSLRSRIYQLRYASKEMGANAEESAEAVPPSA